MNPRKMFTSVKKVKRTISSTTRCMKGIPKVMKTSAISMMIPIP